MLVKEFLFHKVRNGKFLKMRVSEIRVKQIRVNQGLAVLEIDRNKRKFEKNLFNF